MKKTIGSLFLIFSLSIVCNGICVAQLRSSIDKLAWLTGCWVIQEGETVSEEQWMKPTGQAMIGIGRTVAGKQTLFFEYLQIEQKDSVIIYTSKPRGKNPTELVLVEISDRFAVFENFEDPFPQRITYEMDEDGTLSVRKEVREGEQVKTTSYDMRRGTCD